MSHHSITECTEQPPGSEWGTKKVIQDTGLSLEQIDYVERLCHQELVDVPASTTRHKKLSPRNLLFLTLKWLRRYPPLEDLALDFKVSEPSVRNYTKHVLGILDHQLQPLRSWPRQHRSQILIGPLKGTVGAVDTFPICIPQPKTLEGRKRYYIYKPGHKTRYGYKVQTFVDLSGRILNVTSAHPFGSKADITLFRESLVPRKLDPTTRAMAPAPVRLESRVEHRFRNETDEDSKADSDNEVGKKDEDEVEEKDADEIEEKEDSICNISKALTDAKALGDKAYMGSEFVYVPYKKFKGKRFTKAKKDFNKLLSSNRVIVENVNKRLEDWKVLGTIYRGERNAEIVSMIVRVIVSLCNYTFETHPLRKNRSHKALRLEPSVD